MSWWASKARQLRQHLGARVLPQERAALALWMSPSLLALFDGMHRADQRHGLDVAEHLRAHGVDAPDVLAAGLLHDCGKGDTGPGPRVAWSLGERYGSWVLRLVAWVPGWRQALDRIRTHAATSAAMLESAGLAARGVALVRDQGAPSDPEFGARFFAADEAC